MMAAGRRVGHGHGGADPRRPRRRQDRHRGDRPTRRERHVVHRLRAGRQPARRGRGCPLRPGRDGRRDRRARRARTSWRRCSDEAPSLRTMSQAQDTLIDRTFDGRYRILRRLGAGGMANVYLAEDGELGRRVAIKILNDRYANDELFVERFRREAKSAAALSHPNIVSIYDRGEAEGTYYIAMEVIEGRSLKELIRARAAVSGRRRRSRTRARSSRRCASRTGTGSSTATSSRTTSSSARGAAEGHRFRHRARRRLADDRGRLDHGHGAVPLARAGAGRAGLGRVRPLLGRGRALRDADRRGAVHGRHRRRDRDEARERRCPAAVGDRARASRPISTASSSAPREEPGRPLPDRRGARLRPRAASRPGCRSRERRRRRRRARARRRRRTAPTPGARTRADPATGRAAAGAAAGLRRTTRTTAAQAPVDRALDRRRPPAGRVRRRRLVRLHSRSTSSSQEAEPVAVPNVEGLVEERAVEQTRGRRVQRHDREAGERAGRPGQGDRPGSRGREPGRARDHGHHHRLDRRAAGRGAQRRRPARSSRRHRSSPNGGLDWNVTQSVFSDQRRGRRRHLAEPQAGRAGQQGHRRRAARLQGRETSSPSRTSSGRTRRRRPRRCRRRASAVDGQQANSSDVREGLVLSQNPVPAARRRRARR